MLKKRILSCLAVFALLFAMAGCDPVQTPQVGSDAKPEDFLGGEAFRTFADLPCTYLDEDQLNDYLACGFDIYCLHEEYAGAPTDDTSGPSELTDRYKQALQILTEKGVNIFIRNHRNDPDYFVNTDEDWDRERYMFGAYYDLPYRDLSAENFEPYNLQGFYFCDEPDYWGSEQGLNFWYGLHDYEKLVDWYNDNFADTGVYFHVNLFPSYTSSSHFAHPTDQSKDATYEEYVDYYVENFAKKVKGPKSICVDNYPLEPGGEIRASYYENLLLFANKTKEYNEQEPNENYKADMGYCIQAFYHDYGIVEDIQCTEDISFQLCVGMAMGARMYEYWLYTSPPNQHGIVSGGGRKRIYDYVKEANDLYLPLSSVLTNFEWQGLAAVPAEREENRENAAGFEDLHGATPVSEMGALKDVRSSLDTVVGYFTHETGGQPGYMVANCTLPVNGKTSVVFLDFEGHDRVFVYSEGGKYEVLPTVGGQLRLELEAGGGAFVIPA